MFGSSFTQQIGLQWSLLPERLAGHVFLSLVALAIGIGLSVPLGVWCARSRRAEGFVLALASVVQTIPSLALLALMVFVWRTIGWLPALIALILYSVLPVLRNTVTGIRGLDAAYREAALGVGMSGWQMLWWVELPLALPTIVAGVRTASVWVVGTATIAQPVGATSLGNYIFVGLQTLNLVAVLFGCVFSAALALALDGVWAAAERAARQRRARWAFGAAAALLAIACSPLAVRLAARTEDVAVLATARQIVPSEELGPPALVLGGKTFTEQYILVGAMRVLLTEAGLETQVRDGMGSATVFHALARGEIDAYVDYTGTIWANVMKRQEVQPPIETLIDVAAHLKDEYGVLCLGSLGFSNDYVFAMRRADAQRLGIRDLVDLAAHSRALRAATDIEFFDRPEWRRVQRVYGVQFAQQITMDPTLMYGALASSKVDVIIAFGTDGRIAAYDLATLDDPRYALPPYDAVLLVSPRLARSRRAVAAFQPLIHGIDTPSMRAINALVDLEKRPIADGVKALLQRIRHAPKP